MDLDIASIEVRGAPCSIEEINKAEKILEHPLPAELRNIYLNANGFRGPTHAAFLYPLFTQQTFNSETLVNFTVHLRNDPNQPKFWQHAIAFGDYGIGDLVSVVKLNMNVLVSRYFRVIVIVKIAKKAPEAVTFLS